MQTTPIPYNEAYFHADPNTGEIDPEFDSIEAIYESPEFNEDPDGIDVVTFMSSGPYNISSGETIELNFALVFGDDESDLLKQKPYCLFYRRL